MVALYTDEQFSLKAAQHLRWLNYDVQKSPLMES